MRSISCNFVRLKIVVKLIYVDVEQLEMDMLNRPLLKEKSFCTPSEFTQMGLEKE